MIKFDSLKEFIPKFRCSAEDISLDFLASTILEIANNNQIPIQIETNQIKSGGVFNSEVTDCLVLFHPENRNKYFKIALSIKNQGNIAYVSTNYFGESKNQKKLSMRDNAKTNAKNGAKFGLLKAENGADMMGAFTAIGKGAVGGILSLNASKKKQDDENEYYETVRYIIESTFQ
ncbi:hypothetical protein [Fusibacter bizertensis]